MRSFNFFKNIKILMVLLFIVSMYFTSCVFAQAQTTIYVSPNGNDNNSGTLELPFATIQKARDVVRTINKNMTSDIIIYVLGGTYELETPLILTQEDSGTNGYNIKYQSYNCEMPIISGGMRITGWSLHDTNKNIYKAIVDKSIDTRQLYVNGIRAVRARSINADGWIENGDGYDCPAEVSTWKNISNVEVVSYYAWKCHRGSISSVSATLAVMDQPYWSYLHILYGAPAMWIENAYELLDTDGEWYLDNTNGILFYKPRAGEDMAKAEVILPILETLINGTGVNNIQFKGITFAYATWLFPNTTTGFACVQADAIYTSPDWWTSTQIPGNIEFDHCSNLLFENNTFEHFGISGLKLGTGCKSNRIYNNTFEDISGSAIVIGSIMENNISQNDQVKDNFVENNLITDAAVEYKGCVGIFVGTTEHSVIKHNEIRHLPYTGISTGWGWSETYICGINNEIAYNRIDSVMLELFDGGAIYTLGNQPGAEFHHNYISNQFNEPAALYLDAGSSNMHWHHNVVKDGFHWTVMWSSNLYNDTLDFNYYNNPALYFNGINTVLENNVYVSDGNWPPEAMSIMQNSGRIVVFKQDFKITEQPKNATVCIGDTVNLTFSSVGNIIRYQWQKDNEDITIKDNSSAYSQKLVIPINQYEQSGNYRCRMIVDDKCKGMIDVFTDNSIVFVNTTTSIDDQPKDVVIPLDSIVIFTFSAQVNGKRIEDAIQDNEVKVQWYKKKTPTDIILHDDSRFSGTKSNYLKINKFVNADVGKYYAIITNECGSTTTDIVSLKELVPTITITKQPESKSICEGQNIEFNIEANNSLNVPMLFQWTKNGIDLIENSKTIGTKSNKLTLKDVNISDTGNYSVRINILGYSLKNISNETKLDVKSLPIILTQSSTDTIEIGDNFTLSIKTIPNLENKYQWFKDGILLTNEKQDSIIITSAKIEDSGSYWCEITNSCGIINSNKINLIVSPKTNVENYPLKSHDSIKFEITPNPVNDYIEINLERCATLGKCGTSENIQILDVLGVPVTAIHPMTSSHRMNISHLPSGIYFVKIGNWVGKFVKI